MYIAPSFIAGAGKGVFAGTSLAKDTIIEQNPTIIAKTEDMRGWQLFNYVYGANDDEYSMAVFGAAMLYNHKNPKTVENVWAEDVIAAESVQESPSTIYTDVMYRTSKDIRTGEELFTSYGDETWFSARGIPFDNAVDASEKYYTVEELERVGYCLTNIYVKESTVPMAVRGAFVHKPYKKGDIVSVTPVLLVPKHSAKEVYNSSVIMNYLFHFNDASDVFFISTGLNSMINHGGKAKANVKIEWYEWDSEAEKNEKVSKLTANELNEFPFSPLDFAFVATKDIAADEELLLDYGTEWEHKWMEYLDAIEAWSTERYKTQAMLESDSAPPPPQFRYPIGLPAAMFQERFNVSCLGYTGCLSAKQRKRAKLAEVAARAREQYLASRKFMESSEAKGGDEL